MTESEKQSFQIGGTNTKDSAVNEGDTTADQMLLSEDSVMDTFYSQRVEKTSQSPTRNIQPPSCFYTQSKEQTSASRVSQMNEFGLGQSSMPYGGRSTTLGLTKQNSSGSLNTTNHHMYRNPHLFARSKTGVNTSSTSIPRLIANGRDLSPQPGLSYE